MPTYAREDTFAVSVTIDGRDFGVWENRTGGEGDSEDNKVRLGGMGPEVSLGGSKTLGNITLRKLYDLDGIGNDIAWLYAVRGRAPVVVTNQPLDQDGNVHGRRWTWQGVLKAVTPPDYDAQGTDAAYIEIEVAPSGDVS
jgi:hypothetical protein